MSNALFDEKESEHGNRVQSLVVIRHGKRLDSVNPNWQLTHKFSWDSPLSPRGMQECKVKANQLKGLNFGLVAISPFTRCAQTASFLLPHLKLDSDCQIMFHRGLSEVHTYGCLFIGPQGATNPTLCQRFAFWSWKRGREADVLKEFSAIAGVEVQKSFAGKWPDMPEDWDAAARRYASVTDELMELARGRNVLLVTHAEVVIQSISRLIPHAQCEAVDFLGHTIATRQHPEQMATTPSGSNPARKPAPQGVTGSAGWTLQEPGTYSGVTLAPELPTSPRLLPGTIIQLQDSFSQNDGSASPDRPNRSNSALASPYGSGGGGGSGQKIGSMLVSSVNMSSLQNDIRVITLDKAPSRDRHQDSSGSVVPVTRKMSLTSKSSVAPCSLAVAQSPSEGGGSSIGLPTRAGSGSESSYRTGGSSTRTLGANSVKAVGEYSTKTGSNSDVIAVKPY
ncbi:hypothetical protein CEUSTIGMA_g3992.t1 [Chlamydomonas eustigma]|uniref:Uncharacterized protein n=1 Tax=Chlamydomonas eustigma TaxID=1157962 RepID=A0A250X0G8_9CHLO|nr:hypothetical protein CEUSTIGMA_g3992.t1 [Chlamydomonas eustigma]|eukprot:GAX76546.1 hypothetical protein CEUSTIGMA_g3992.t1 [Chlamydomonas eustigma]